MPPFNEGTQQSYIHWQLANWLPMHVAWLILGLVNFVSVALQVTVV